MTTNETKTSEEKGGSNDSNESKTVNAGSSVDSQAEINERDVKWRAKHKDALEKMEGIKKQSEEEKKELSSKLDHVQKTNEAMQQRVIDAELKAQAVSAGLKDLDFLKMVDKSSFKIGEDGNITGIDKAINDLKSTKPFLFSDNKRTSTSKNESLPNGDKNSNSMDAMKMTDEEWNANKHRYMTGQFN